MSKSFMWKDHNYNVNSFDNSVFMAANTKQIGVSDRMSYDKDKKYADYCLRPYFSSGTWGGASIDEAYKVVEEETGFMLKNYTSSIDHKDKVYEFVKYCRDIISEQELVGAHYDAPTTDDV